MKRTITLLISLAALVIFPACQKVAPVQDDPAAKKQVTVTASIPADGLTTRVALTQDETSKKTIKLSWEDDDVITINGEPFTIDPATISSNGKTAQFTGNDPGSGPYTIVYSVFPTDFSRQVQTEDGTTDHLGYSASLAGVTDYDVFSFDSEWAAAKGATLEQSSVLRLRAFLPEDVASNVQKVIFKASQPVFGGSNTLTVSLTYAGTTGTDNELDVYASLPAGDVTLSDDMDLLIQFQVSDAEYDKYTAYRKVASGTNFIISGQSQYLGIKCPNIESFANPSTSGIGESEDNPYLIGDQHQLDAVRELMVSDQITYFKLLDDIDLTGIVWESLANTAENNAYRKFINFDGNLKTISNLSTSSETVKEYPSLFGVLQGSVKDLTIDHATIIPGSKKSGVVAGYIGTGTNYSGEKTVENVHVTNSSVTDGSSYCGGFAGQMNRVGYVFSNCSVENTTVSSTGYAAGFIAYFQRSATVSDITVTNTNVSSTGHSNTANPAPDGFAGGIAARLVAAVDFDRCIYSGGKIIGPTQANNDNSKINRFVGGLVAYVPDVAATFDDCKVIDAILGLESAPATNNYRHVGGAFGYLGASVLVGNTTGCSVTGLSTENTVRNYVGGFVSYLDGATVKNSSASSSSAIGNATYSGAVGGFVGYCVGGTLYNNTSSVDVQGAGNPGGFVGWNETTATAFEKCSASGSVTAGSNNAGGFAGYVKIGSTFTECSSEGTVTSSAGYVGGLIGYVNADNVVITKCQSTSTISASGNYVGGLVGVCESDTIEKSTYEGTVTGNSRVGGILGISLKDDAVTIKNCYSRGKVIGSSTEQRFGGIVGDLGKGGTIENCWSDAEITAGRVCGGIVGLACYQTWGDGTVANNTVTGCIAWNPKVVAAQSGNFGSSGAVIGHTSFKNTFGRSYRRPDMVYQNSYNCAGGEWNTSMVDQPDCNGTNWAKGTTPGTNASYTYQQPYYGVAASSTATVSSIAQSLGWSGEIWDFSTDLPTLK